VLTIMSLIERLIATLFNSVHKGSFSYEAIYRWLYTKYNDFYC